MNYKNLFYLCSFFATALFAFVPEAAHAQARINPSRTSDLSDKAWNLWRIGVETCETADKAYTEKRYAEAGALYEKTLETFRKVQAENSSWNKRGLEYRIKSTARKLELAKKKSAAAPLTASATDEQKVAAAKAEAMAEIADLKLQLADLRKTLESTRRRAAADKLELEKVSKTAAQVSALLAEKQEMDKKYSLLLIQYSDLQKNPRETEREKALAAAFESEKKQGDILRESLKTTTSEVARLQASLAQLEREKAELQRSIKNMESQLAASERALSDTAALRGKLADSEKARSEALQKFEAERKRLQDEIIRKSMQVDETNEALIKLRGDLSLDEVARALEKEAASLRAVNEKFSKEIETLKVQVSDLQFKLRNAEESEKQAKNMAKNLSEQNKQLAQDIQRARKQAESGASEYRKLSAELEKVKGEVAAVRAERDAFAGQLSKSMGDSSSTTAAELAKAKAELAALNEKNAALAELRKKFQNDAEESEKKREELQDALDDAVALKEKLQTKIAELEKQKSSISASLDKVNADTKAKLESREADLKRVQTELKATQGRLTAAEDSKKELYQQQEALKKELEKAVADLKTKSGQMEKLEADMAQNSRLLAEAGKNNADAVKEKEALVLKNNALAKEKDALTGELAAARKQVEKLTADAAASRLKERAELEKECEALKKQLAEAEQSIADLKKLSGNADAVDTELKTMRAKILSLEQEKTALQKEKEELQKLNTQLQARAGEYDTFVSNASLLRSVQMENRILKVQLQNARERKQDDGLAKELQTAKMALENLQKEYGRNVSETSRMKGVAAEMRIRIVALEKEIESLNKQFEAAGQDAGKQAEIERVRKIGDLERQLAEWREKEKAQLRVNDLLKKERTEIGQALAAAEKQAQEAKNKVAELELEAAEKQKKLEALEAQVRELQAAGGKVSSAEVAELQKQFDLLKAEKQALAAKADSLEAGSKAQIQRLELDLKSSREAIAVREKSIAGLQKELEESQNALQQAAQKTGDQASVDAAKIRTENSRLSAEIRKLEAEKQKIARSLEAKELEYNEIYVKLAKAQSVTAADAEKYEELNNRLKAAAGLAEKNAAAMKKAEADAAREKQRNAELAARNEKLKNEAEAANSKAAKLQAEVDKWAEGSDSVLVDKVTEKDQAIKDILKEQEELTAEIEKMREELRIAQLNAAGSRKEAAAAKAEARKAMSDLQQIRKDTGKQGSTMTMTTGTRIVQEKSGEGTVIYRTSSDGTSERIPETPEMQAQAQQAAAQKAETDAKTKIENVLAEITAEQRKKFDDFMAEGAKFESEKDYDQAVYNYLLAADAVPGAWTPQRALAKIYVIQKNAELAKSAYEKSRKLGASADAQLEQSINAISSK